MENQLLDVGFREENMNLEPVSSGKRFGNLLIDMVVWYIIAIVIMGVFFASNPDAIDELGRETTNAQLTAYLIIYGTMIGYYFLSETLFKGRTIGKMITGCRAINTDGSTINAGTAIKRTLCRIVPFEHFSFLGNPVGWHDKWTSTIVVSEKEFQKYA
jgi:uncharacterized RDD family membrane protein YckC